MPGENAAKGLLRTLGGRAKEGLRKLDEDRADQCDDEDAQFEIQQMQKYIDRLRGEHEYEISNCNASLQQEREYNKKMKESVNKMQFAMESKDLFIGEQDSDDMIYSKFQALVSKIKTWSVPFAQGSLPLSKAFSEAELQDAEKVVPNVTDLASFHRLLQLPKNMRLFVRGLVGLEMTESIFRAVPHDDSASFSGQDIWMDKDLAFATATVEERFFYSDRRTVSFRDLHDWRALTANIISRLNGTSNTGKGMEACVTQCSSRIVSLVHDWISPDARKTLEKDLLEILLEAVDLSRTLRRQRACWTVRHFDGLPTRNSPVLLDETVMEDVHGDDESDNEGIRTAYKRAIDVIASPALFKRGDSDGKRFEVETCVVKAEVKSSRVRLRGRA